MLPFWIVGGVVYLTLGYLAIRIWNARCSPFEVLGDSDDPFEYFFVLWFWLLWGAYAALYLVMLLLSLPGGLACYLLRKTGAIPR